MKSIRPSVCAWRSRLRKSCKTFASYRLIVEGITMPGVFAPASCALAVGVAEQAASLSKAAGQDPGKNGWPDRHNSVRSNLYLFGGDEMVNDRFALGGGSGRCRRSGKGCHPSFPTYPERDSNLHLLYDNQSLMSQRRLDAGPLPPANSPFIAVRCSRQRPRNHTENSVAVACWCSLSFACNHAKMWGEVWWKLLPAT